MGCNGSRVANEPNTLQPSLRTHTHNPLREAPSPEAVESSRENAFSTPSRSPVSDAFATPHEPPLQTRSTPLAVEQGIGFSTSLASDDAPGLLLDHEQASTDGFSTSERSPMWWAALVQGPGWETWRVRVGAEPPPAPGSEPESSDSAIRELVGDWFSSVAPSIAAPAP